MRRAGTPALMVMVAALALDGCATRTWVNDLVRKREAHIDERVTRVAGETARLDNELTGIEGRVAESSETARFAQRRADEAYARADDANTRLTRLWASRHKRDLVDTVDVQFGFDRTDLGDSAQSTLLAVIRELRENPRLTVDLEGFTDPSGPREYNIALSQRRVEAVRRFLIHHGTDLWRVNSVGLGPVRDGKDEAARQRRVSVKLMLSTE